MTEVTLGGALVLLVVGALAGGLGGSLGIGGGIFIVPALTLTLGLEVKWAISASLVCIAASSMAAGPRHLRHGTVNLRIGIVLSVGAAVGGTVGGLVGDALPANAVLWVLAGVALLAATVTAAIREKPEDVPVAFAGEGPDEWPGTLGGTYSTESGAVPYSASRPLAGAMVASVAALIGAVAGVGGGFLNVPQMRLIMGLPVRVAGATSTFIVGISAASALVVYASAGRIAPAIAAPLLLGAIPGSIAGARIQHRFRGSALKWVLVVILAALSVQIAWGAWRG